VPEVGSLFWEAGVMAAYPHPFPALKTHTGSEVLTRTLSHTSQSAITSFPGLFSPPPQPTQASEIQHHGCCHGKKRTTAERRGEVLNSFHLNKNCYLLLRFTNTAEKKANI